MYLRQTKQNSYICTSECGCTCRCVGHIRESYFTASEYDNIFQKYTESFYLAATMNSLFQGFIMLSMKSYNSEWETQ